MDQSQRAQDRGCKEEAYVQTTLNGTAALPTVNGGGGGGGGGCGGTDLTVTLISSVLQVTPIDDPATVRVSTGASERSTSCTGCDLTPESSKFVLCHLNQVSPCCDCCDSVEKTVTRHADRLNPTLLPPLLTGFLCKWGSPGQHATSNSHAISQSVSQSASHELLLVQYCKLFLLTDMSILN